MAMDNGADSHSLRWEAVEIALGLNNGDAGPRIAPIPPLRDRRSKGKRKKMPNRFARDGTFLHSSKMCVAD
jgi:hypothetical protein